MEQILTGQPLDAVDLRHGIVRAVRNDLACRARVPVLGQDNIHRNRDVKPERRRHQHQRAHFARVLSYFLGIPEDNPGNPT